MSCGIYKITNTINGKYYIGQSIHIEERWKEEIRYMSNSNVSNYHYPLACAFRKYGIENFTFEILKECRTDELDKYEIEYIKQFNSYNNGYNQTSGGTNAEQATILTWEQVKEIINLLKNSDMSQEDIANKFKVTRTTVGNINLGKSWFQDDVVYPIRRVRLYQEEVDEIIKLLKDMNITMQSIADDYGISVSMIYKINTGENWHNDNIDYPIRKKRVSSNIYANKSKPLYQIDKNDHSKIIKQFPSVKEAAIACNGCHSNIVVVCNKKRLSAYGYYWQYVEDYNAEHEVI